MYVRLVWLANAKVRCNKNKYTSVCLCERFFFSRATTKHPQSVIYSHSYTFGSIQIVFVFVTLSFILLLPKKKRNKN